MWPPGKNTPTMQTVLIANRGAIARRVIRACHALGLKSVVLYSEADVDAPYLAEASQAVALPGFTAQETYLNQSLILEAAKTSGADALHPGYGFLSENAEFAQAIIDQDLQFIGPAPIWLDQMGDKVVARRLMAQQGFPVFAGSELVTDLKQAKQQAQAIGYPVVVKPAGGGGGMGMQVVENPNALTQAIKRAQAISQAAFATDEVYLERWLTRPRHIEFQVLADGGGAIHAYERECSVQRRHQKLIEESPAPGIDSRRVLAQAERAATACAALGYNNVGTLGNALYRQR